jgi:hypothetical protein
VKQSPTARALGIFWPSMVTLRGIVLPLSISTISLGSFTFLPPIDFQGEDVLDGLITAPKFIRHPAVAVLPEKLCPLIITLQ